MTAFIRERGRLMVDGIACQDLADEFGTPLFVYSRSAIENAWHQFTNALTGHDHLVCYAVKANSNLAVLDCLARLGSGFDIVSGGELKRVLAAGGTPSKIVFSGVGKSTKEITQALEAGICCFNVESAGELERLAELAAAHGVRAPVSLRINPDVDAQTHPYISTGLKENKFGISVEEAWTVYARAAELDTIDIQGIDCHLGSQLSSVEPYREALAHLIRMVDRLYEQDIVLSHIDVGGGQGICYRDETPLDIDVWSRCVREAIGERKLSIVVEPGRYIVGNAGVMLTRVEYLKSNPEKAFVVVDGAMNDLIRPALYDAWQGIETVETLDRDTATYDVVGPVCESADFLGKGRSLAVSEGDVLAVMGSGAYGMAMSSNYNTRPRAAEVMVSSGEAHLVRAREETEALFAREYMLP